MLPGSLAPAPATTAAAPDLAERPAGAGRSRRRSVGAPGSDPGPGGPVPVPVPVPVPPPPATGVPLVDEVVDTVLDVLEPDRPPPPVPAAPSPVPTTAPLLDVHLDLPLLR